MKVLRLDLRAYAHFSKIQLHFNESKPIHIVLGKNEAGKTSLSKAFKALFTGFEKKAFDDFTHAFDDLYIEGSLVNDQGKYLQICRQGSTYRKRQSELMPYLVDIDKKTFSSIFFWSQESIFMGSKELLENIRHFDRTLFSSIQGGKSVLNLLAQIESEASNLYKSRGTKPTINQHIESLKSLYHDFSQQSVSVSDAKVLEKQRLNFVSEQKKIRQQEKNYRKKVDELTLLKKTYISLKSYSTQLQDLKNYDSSSLINESFLNKYMLLQQKSRTLNEQKEELFENLERLDFEIKNFNIPESLIKHKEHIQQLIYEFPKINQYIVAEKKLISDLQILKDKYKKINLDLQNKIHTSISAATWKKIKSKILQVIESIKINTHALKGCVLQEENLKANLNQLGQLRDIDQIKAQLKRIQAFKEKIEWILDESLGLVGHSSLIKNTSHVKVSSPENDLTKLRELVQKHNQTQLLYQSSNKFINEFESDLEKFAALEKNSEESFDSYFTNKRSRQKLTQELLKPWSADDYLEKYQLFTKLAHSLTKEDEIEAIWLESPQVLIQLEEKKKLKNRLNTALQKHRHLEQKLQCQKQNFLNEIESELQELFQILNLSQTEISLSHFLRLLDKQLKQLTDQLLKSEQTNQKITASQKALETVSAQKQNEEKKLRSVEKIWSQLCQQFAIQVPFDVNPIVKFVELFDVFFELSHNIKMQNETLKLHLTGIQQFKKIWKKYFPEKELSEVNVNSIRKDLHEAEAGQKQQDKLFVYKEASETEIEQIDQQMFEIETLISKLLLKYRVSKDEITIDKLSESQGYYELFSTLKEKKKTLEIQCHQSIDNLLRKVEGYTDISDVEQAFDESNAQLQQAEIELSTLDRQIGAIKYQEKQICDFTKKNHIETEIQTVTFDFQEAVKNYLISRVSAAYLKDYMRSHQSRNRENLLTEAALYFEKITDGKYIHLNLNLLNSKESLLECVNPSGMSLGVHQLSEGTRDQLFLSLKFAFLKHYCCEHESFPLILDDILVNFDDQRALNCIRLIQELSQNTQVIFLTHHKHLVELFKQATQEKDVQYHQLESSSKELVE